MTKQDTIAEDDVIDVLLERYLELLDGYTKLRAELSELQSSVSGIYQIKVEPTTDY